MPFANAAAATAETVWVRDEIYVPLRRGESQQHRILHQGVPSGTPMELLEQNEETGYSKVRLPNGLEGYMQTQYIVYEPIARDQLERVSAELEEARRQRQEALGRVQTLQQERAELQRSLETVQAGYARTTDELAEITELSADTVRVHERNKALQAERAALEQQIDALAIENDRLQDRLLMDWFLRGAGVVGASLLVGFWFARRMYLRRNTMWT